MVMVMNSGHLQKRSFLLAVSIFLMGSILSYPSFSDDDQVAFGKSRLSILSDDRRHDFIVEVADTDETRAKGLMFRQEMADSEGMLFLFRENKMVIMWMKNTFIPLDIIFINQKGVIVHIVKSTTPESLAYISSEKEVISALEVNAGLINRLNISIGDKIDHIFFTQ
ncbi:MAG: DUF192 domain-containing protein [Emcibacter sp.]|nr:DUF192 domain-containing protein [Emcibacter sp.]